MRSSPTLGVHSAVHSSAGLLAGFAVLLCVSLLAGCGGEVGEKLIPVGGKVSYQGRPVPRGTVSLRPDSSKGNESQHHPTGTIQPDGGFRLYTAGREGAPCGWYKVVIFATEEDRPTAAAHPGLPKTIIPPNYNQPGTTPLDLDVKEGMPAGLEFTLVGKTPGGSGTK